MRVISRRELQDFWTRHPDAEEPLRQWFKTALAARWRNLMDVRAVYPHADGVETTHSGILTVFNVCGKKYRLVTRIRYERELVNVRCVLTHAEYNKGKWRV